MISLRALLILLATYAVLGLSPVLVLLLPERAGAWLFGDRLTWLSVPWLVFYSLPLAVVCSLIAAAMFLWR